VRLRPTWADCVEKLAFGLRRDGAADSIILDESGAHAMMGEQRTMQEALFYGFSLERHVPSDHLLRKIDRFVDLTEVRAHLEPYYSEVGRPSIDPELMMRMLIVGYCFGVRSERRLCDEVHLNLAYRWFCRLGLDGEVPDHSTFSKNRHGRFRDSDLLRKLFETVVARCMKERLVGGDAFAVDASMIAADAHRRRKVAKTEDLDPTSSRAVAEFLSVLDDAAFGAATPVEPKSISPVDPAARYTAAADGPAVYAYSDNYLIDLKHAIIMDVEATTAIRQAEVGAAKTMLDRTAEQFDVTPDRLVADAGYGSAEMLGWLVDERGIEPHVKVFDKSERTDGTFSRSDFAFDAQNDLYVCPGGHELRRYRRVFLTPRDGIGKDDAIRYRASKRDCDACALKPKCCPNIVARKIARSIYEAARDKARAIAKTAAYAISRRERKKVEMLFAHLKRILKLDRLRLRGPNGAKDEFLLAATAQNLRKMAKLVPHQEPIFAS
jgi:transposase